MLAIQRA